MLTADHVRARRRGSTLTLTPLKPHDRGEMLDYSSRCIQLLKRSPQRRREEIIEVLSDLIIPSYLQRVAEGLKKLLFDRCTFASPEDVDPISLRSLLFKVASEMRFNLDDGASFNREAALTAAAAQLDIDIYRIDEVLFSDLKGEQRLERFDPLAPQQLLDTYELAQEQALLLRASEVTVQISCEAVNTYRYFFRQLKFRRLLFDIQPIDSKVDGSHGYEIKMSGPHHLFKSSTKYGLQLALILPALRLCNQWRLYATVHWGKERVPLQFHTEGGCTGEADPSTVEVPEEVQTLMGQLKKNKTLWRARRSNKIIHLPGVGMCIPDLILSHPDHKEKIYLEVMGYWSRDAVWKRVELVEAGMSERVIFAVSSRLRVSERVLDDDLPSALYVYKGAIVVRTLVALLERMIQPPSNDEENASLPEKSTPDE